MPRHGLIVGGLPWEFAFADGQVLRAKPAGPVAPPVANVAEAVRLALEAPVDFPPLRQALTPDDDVAVVVRPTLNRLPEILAALLNHILSAQVQPERVVLIPAAAPGERTVDLKADLPAPLQSVRVVAHDRADQKGLAYLAGTEGGRAVYLNRHLVDAGQVVVVGQLRFDPLFGYRGGLDEFFPLLSDAATWQEFALHPSDTMPGTRDSGTAAEANEVGWLLGLPFLLQVLEGEGNDVASVLAGTQASLQAKGQRLLDRQRRLVVGRSADLVLATLAGDPARQSLVEVARAFAAASRVVRPGGTIAVLSAAAGEAGPGLAHFRGADTPIAGLRQAKQHHAADFVTLWELASAAQHARLFLHSRLPAEQVEEIFITPLDDATQVQRLIEEADTVLLLPDADRTLASLEGHR